MAEPQLDPSKPFTSADGMIAAGNIDLSNRPQVKNADGSISTIRSIGVNIDGKEVLIPTVVGNRVVSNDEAIKEYKRTGKHLGMFDTPEHATAFAQSLHEKEAAKLDQAFDPSKPFSIVEAPPPQPVLQRMTAGMVDPRTLPRDQQLNPLVVHALPPKAEAAFNSPLVHLTGIAAIDDLTSPANLALTAALGARSAGKALGAAAEAISAGVDSELVAKTLKFLTPTKFREGLDLLTSMAKKAAGASPTASAPAPVAAPAASAPGAPAPVVAAPAPGAPPVPQVAPPSPQSASAGPSPVGPSPVPQAPPPDVMRRLSPATEAAVSVPPPPTMGPDGLLSGRPGGNPSMPDQKALNEAALAVRRAAYQARMSSAPPPVEAPAAPAAGNVKLSAAETKAFLDLMKRGVSGPDAMKNVLMQRELAARLGSPTDAAMKADMTSRYRAGQKTLGGYDKP